jgi:hypothetical protein
LITSHSTRINIQFQTSEETIPPLEEIQKHGLQSDMLLNIRLRASWSIVSYQKVVDIQMIDENAYAKEIAKDFFKPYN